MIDDADADKIAQRVAVILRKDRRGDPSLLTIPEVAARYRQNKENVRRDAKDGLIKCKKRKVRNGKESFMIDAKDAERVYGAH